MSRTALVLERCDDGGFYIDNGFARVYVEPGQEAQLRDFLRESTPSDPIQQAQALVDESVRVVVEYSIARVKQALDIAFAGALEIMMQRQQQQEGRSRAGLDALDQLIEKVNATAPAEEPDVELDPEFLATLSTSEDP